MPGVAVPVTKSGSVDSVDEWLYQKCFTRTRLPPHSRLNEHHLPTPLQALKQAIECVDNFGYRFHRVRILLPKERIGGKLVACELCNYRMTLAGPCQQLVQVNLLVCADRYAVFHFVDITG